MTPVPDSPTDLRWRRALVIVLALLAGAYLLQLAVHFAGYLGDVIKLYFAAWVWHFLLEPPINWLCSRRWPRMAAAALVYVGAIVLLVAILLLLMPPVLAQFTDLGRDLLKRAAHVSLASLSANLQEFIREHAPTFLRQPLLDAVRSASSRLQEQSNNLSGNILSLNNTLTTVVVNRTFTLLNTTLNLLFFIFTMLILSFFMTMSGDAAIRPLLALVPRHWEPDVRAVTEVIDRAFAGFVRGQLLLSTIYGVLLYLIMELFAWIAGGSGQLGSFALVAAVLAGIIMIIPAVGTTFSMLPPMLIGLLTISWPLSLVLVAAIWAVNLVMANMVGPRVMSQAVGINPVWSFGALLIGAKLGGIVGAFFGVPILAVAIAIAERILLHLRSKGSADAERADVQSMQEAVPATDDAARRRALSGVEPRAAQVDPRPSGFGESSTRP